MCARVRTTQGDSGYGGRSQVSYEGRELWKVPMIRGRLLDMGGDEALFYLAYDSILVVASIHDPSLVRVCTRRCYTSADTHDVSRLDVFPPRRDRGGGWDAEGGESSEAEGSGAAAGLTGTVLVGGGGVDMGGHWGGGMAGGMGEDGMETFHALHGMGAAHVMLGLPGEVPRVAMSGKAVVCAELADSCLVSLRVWFGDGPTSSKAMDRARCKLAVQRLLVRDVPRNVNQKRQPDLVHHAALDYFFMLLAVTSLKMEEMEDGAKGEELLAPNLAPRHDRPDHAPGAANPVAQDSVQDGMAGMRMEELRVCLEVARVRRGCGNKEVRSPPVCHASDDEFPMTSLTTTWLASRLRI